MCGFTIPSVTLETTKYIFPGWVNTRRRLDIALPVNTNVRYMNEGIRGGG